MAKTDTEYIKSAFRIKPDNPQNYHLLGSSWNNQYYYDNCMPMGCASYCKTFEAFSIKEWITQEKLSRANLLRLLVDCLLIQPKEDQCLKSLELFLELCDF